jgi:hypothetical protein
LIAVDFLWAEIQISRENRNLPKRNQNREGVMIWSIAVEDLGWMITQSEPEMLENISTHTHTHTHQTQREKEIEGTWEE